MKINTYLSILLILFSLLTACSKESLDIEEPAIEEKGIQKITHHFNTMKEYRQFVAKQEALLNKEFAVNIPVSSDAGAASNYDQTSGVPANWGSGYHSYQFEFNNFTGTYPDRLEFNVQIAFQAYSPAYLQGVFLTPSWGVLNGIDTHLEQAQFFISGYDYYTATLHWIYVEKMVVGSVVVNENYYKVLGTVKRTEQNPSFVTAVLSYTKKN